MALVITISDPSTLALLQQYGQYVHQVDGERATMDELAEGLMLGMLDEHQRFREWSSHQVDVAA